MLQASAFIDEPLFESGAPRVGYAVLVYSYAGVGLTEEFEAESPGGVVGLNDETVSIEAGVSFEFAGSGFERGAVGESGVTMAVVLGSDLGPVDDGES